MRMADSQRRSSVCVNPDRFQGATSGPAPPGPDGRSRRSQGPPRAFPGPWAAHGAALARTFPPPELQSATASSRPGASRAEASTSAAPTASFRAGGSPGDHGGRTQVHSDRPKFFSARAAAPRFSGVRGCIRTKRTDVGMVKRGAYGVKPTRASVRVPDHAARGAASEVRARLRRPVAGPSEPEPGDTGGGKRRTGPGAPSSAAKERHERTDEAERER